MQKQGTITRWDHARGFGFIRSPETSADVFFHVRDFRGDQPPREGQPVVFEEIHVGGKGPRATGVQPADGAAAARPRPRTLMAGQAKQRNAHPAPRAPDRQRPSTGARTPGRGRRATGAAGPASVALVVLAGLWLVLLAWGIWAGRLAPGWTLAAALGVNLLTYAAYAIDKNAAQQRQWRIAEKHLHLLSLAGGWPAAWIAQQTLRHKSQKTEFRMVYWGTVVLHNAALAAWAAGLIHLP